MVQTTKKDKGQAAAAAQKLAHAATGSKIPMLGFTIWWTIHQDLMFSVADLEKKVEATIGKDCLPPVPSKRRALRVAIQAVEEAGLVRRIRNDKGVLAFILATEQIDQKNIDLDLIKRNVIVYDSKNDKLDIRQTHKKTEILQMFEKYTQMYTEDDVRGAVMRYLRRNGAITMRETGGIYFVREQSVHDVLKAFVGACGCVFYSLPVPDVEGAKGTMYTIVRDELQRDLEVAAEEVKELIAREGVRTTSLQDRIERFKLLRGKTEMYRDLLQNDIESMTTKLGQLGEEVMKALVGELEAYPQAEKFPYRCRVKYIGKGSKDGKDKKGPQLGTVVGYYIGAEDKIERVKVLWDDTETITPRRLNQIQRIEVNAKTAAVAKKADAVVEKTS